MMSTATWQPPQPKQRRRIPGPVVIGLIVVAVVVIVWWPVAFFLKYNGILIATGASHQEIFDNSTRIIAAATKGESPALSLGGPVKYSKECGHEDGVAEPLYTAGVSISFAGVPFKDQAALQKRMEDRVSSLIHALPNHGSDFG